MSEAEKRRRQEYKRLRAKWILIQAIVLVVATAIVLAMSFTYYFVNQTKYVDYTERSDINYLVKLAPNEFYDQELLEKDRAYVTALMETVDAEFDYELNMSAFADVVFSYSYTIDATLLITDKYTDAVVYDAKTELVPAMYYTQNGASNFAVHETVSVNIKEYNDKAVKFIETYGLKNANAQLLLTMNMDTKSTCVEFENKSANSYFTTVTFPLAVETSEPVTTSSVADGEIRTLACKSSTNATVFLVLGIIFGVLDLLLGGFFVFFVLKTKNHDINYTNKVKRLVASYRSFIQEITVPFSTEGYQQVYIKTFNEMLDVRDTIGSPLLMYANEDGTATTFVIPTNTGLIYIYEIRVENYDDIYGISDPDNEVTDDASTNEKPDLCEMLEIGWQKVKEFFCFIGRKMKIFFCFVGRKIKALFSKKPKKEAKPVQDIPVQDAVETEQEPSVEDKAETEQDISAKDQKAMQENQKKVDTRKNKKRRITNKRKTKVNPKNKKKRKNMPIDKKKTK